MHVCSTVIFTLDTDSFYQHISCCLYISQVVLYTMFVLFFPAAKHNTIHFSTVYCGGCKICNYHYCSVAQIIRSVIRKTIYWPYFCISVLDQHHDRKSSRYRYTYLFKIHAHVHQMMFTNAELHSSKSRCCYYCLNVLFAIFVALLSM